MADCKVCGSYGKTSAYAAHCRRADCPVCEHGIKGDFCGECFPKEIETVESLRARIATLEAALEAAAGEIAVLEDELREERQQNSQFGAGA